jgi:TolB-like protein
VSTVALCAFQASAADDIKALAKAIAGTAGAQKIKRVAVVPFTGPRGTASYSGSIVSERLVVQILARGEIDVVERRFLEKVLEEQRLGVFGIMDPATVKTLGKVLGVDAILTGTVVELKGERVEVNARLINTETAQVLAAATAVTEKDWEDRPQTEEAATWIVPVPELPGEAPSNNGGSACQAKVDAVERRMLDFKARYWADRLKDPSFSVRSLKQNPGTEIKDLELRAEFYKLLRQRYDSSPTPLNQMERAELGRGLQELKVLNGLCEG